MSLIEWKQFCERGGALIIILMAAPRAQDEVVGWGDTAGRDKRPTERPGESE